jgi:hypothetical protein
MVTPSRGFGNPRGCEDDDRPPPLPINCVMTGPVTPDGEATDRFTHARRH